MRVVDVVGGMMSWGWRTGKTTGGLYAEGALLPVAAFSFSLLRDITDDDFLGNIVVVVIRGII